MISVPGNSPDVKINLRKGLTVFATSPEYGERKTRFSQIGEDLESGNPIFGSLVLELPKNPNVILYELGTSSTLRLEELREYAVKKKCDLLLIDSYYQIYTPKEEGVTEALLIRKLKSFPCSVVLLASITRAKTDMSRVIRPMHGGRESLLTELAANVIWHFPDRPSEDGERPGRMHVINGRSWPVLETNETPDRLTVTGFLATEGAITDGEIVKFHVSGLSSRQIAEISKLSEWAVRRRITALREQQLLPCTSSNGGCQHRKNGMSSAKLF